MSGPKVITWLPINTTLIAPSQSLAAAGNLVLNSSVPGLRQGAFIYDKVIRKVQLTTSGNEAAVSFTITGIGTPIDPVTKNPTGVVGLISETIVNGPIAGAPVNSVNIYQKIISISANAAVVNIAAGSGPDGITDFVFLNYNSVYGGTNFSIQIVNPILVPGIAATTYVSLNRPQIVDINAGNLIDSPFMSYRVLASTQIDAFSTIGSPCSVIWINIIDTTTESINFTVLEQGIA